jgi:hypothetical protein
MTVYKLTRKSQMFVIRALSQIAIWGFGVLFILQIIFPKIFMRDISEGFSALSYWIALYIVMEILPLTTVHFQYYKYNKDTELCIDKNKRIIIVKEKDNAHSFRFDQIKIIHLAMQDWLINGRESGFIVVNRYHYALIETLDGHRFFITCLLINNLMKFFDENGLHYEKELVLWPRIRLGRYK